MVGLELAFGTRRLEPKKLLLILEFFIKRFALWVSCMPRCRR